MYNRLTATTLLILAFILMTRIPYITNSPYETGENWRQSDTESMARNFVHDRFNILFPQLNYDGPPPNYAQLEFQITTFLIALLYKLFGFHYVLARIVPILFFVGSVYFLYLIARRFYNPPIAWISMFVYALFPVNLFNSRAIMPESAAMFFYLGAFYFFVTWIDRGKSWRIITSALFTAMAIAIKVPAIFIGIPMLVMSLVKFKLKVFVTWQLWLFAAVSLLLPLWYYQWLGTVAEFRFVEGIGTKHIIPKFATALWTPEAYTFFRYRVPAAFTWIGLLISGAGIFTMNWKREWPTIVWLIAMMLEVATIVAVIRFPYYLVFITPVMALIAGKALYTLAKWGRTTGAAIAAVLVMGLGITGILQVKPMLAENKPMLRQAEVIRTYTKPDDLIVVGTLSPSLLNAADRNGWRANVQFYTKSRSPESELAIYIKQGARYFAPSKGYIYGDENNAYRRYLEEHFEKLEVEIEGEDYSFYKLHREVQKGNP